MRLVAALAVAAVLAFPALSPPAAAASTTWTFLVYLDADNSLEPVGISDFLEMAQVGSTPNLNVVVQFDRSVGRDASYGNWTTAKRFRVTAGMTPTPANALQDLGEVNMADPTVLRDFLVWGLTAYPSDRVFLDLWDHGLGWQGVLVDGGAFMATTEVAWAVAQAAAATGRHFDILGNDACQMTLEIMYELRDHVDVFVGSEKDEPVQGWPYDALLAPIAADPSISPAEVATRLVDAYVTSYAGASPLAVTLSAVTAAALPPLVASLNEFTAELNRSNRLFRDPVLLARGATEHYEKAGLIGGDGYDLYDFAESVRAWIPSPRLGGYAARLQDAITAAVLAEGHWDRPDPANGVHAGRAHGLSIWFPFLPEEPAYADLAFARDSLWDEFLAAYRTGLPTPVSLVADADVVDANRDGLGDGLLVNATGNASGTLVVELYAFGAYRASHAAAFAANATTPVRFLGLAPGQYDAWAYLYNATLLLAVAEAPSRSITTPITFRGTVRDVEGVEIEGAVVTLRNLRSGESVSVNSGQGGYAFVVTYPGFFQRGDVVRLRAAFRDRVAEATFSPSPDAPTQVVDLVMEIRLTEAPPQVLYGYQVGLALVSALAGVLLVYAVRLRSRFRRETEGRPPR